MIQFPDRSKAPELHSFGTLSLDNPDTEVLTNGMNVHFFTNPDIEVCRMSVAIPGGEAETSPDGALRVVAPALSEGTIHHSGSDLASLLEDYGAWSGASLSTHYTIYSVSCLTRHLPRLLPLIKEVVFEPSFEENAMSQLTESIAARNELDRCKVEWQASEALKQKIYGDLSPLSVSPTPDEIRAVTSTMLKEAHSQRLNPTEMHIFLSGGITKDIIDGTRDIFGSLIYDCDTSIRGLHFPVYDGSREIFTEMPDSLQSALAMAIPSVGRDHPDFVALRMAVIALGGYFGSRLMMNIREEKGLTYGIGSALVGYREKSFISITTQTATEYVEEVRKEILYEIERMKDPASYTPDELDRLGFYILSSLASSLDTPFSRMDLWQSYFLSGAPDGYFAAQDYLARNLSAETLAEMARKYFDRDMLFCSIAGREISRL